jgi:hypothetical protein
LIFHSRLFLAIGVGLCVPYPLCAADHKLPIGDFERINVIGSMHVIVTESRMTTLRVVGDADSLETLKTDVQSGILKIRNVNFNWGSSGIGAGGNYVKARPPVTIYLTTPRLRTAALSGSGVLEIGHMRAPKIDLQLQGSGALRVTQIDTDVLTANVTGSGALRVGGRAAQANLSVQGSGAFDAETLLTKDAQLSTAGAASLTVSVSRNAQVEATGSSSIKVLGKPVCKVHNAGVGEVICGQ